MRTPLIAFLLLTIPMLAAGIDRRPATRTFVSKSVETQLAAVATDITDTKLREMFVNCYPNTLDTTVKPAADGSEAFIITGDINAMWLRDASGQLYPYTALASGDTALRKLIASVIRRQTQCLLTDVYANAFNMTATGEGWHDDLTTMRDEVYERKWELDSPCYAIRLAYAYWQQTHDTSPFGATWHSAMQLVYDTMREQQRYQGRGQYKFQRKTHVPTDTQQGYGWGAPVRPCGLIFSAFRPSDDATTYGFLIPSNMMAVVSLRQLAEMLTAIAHDDTLAGECRALADEVDAAIQRVGIVEHPRYGRMYAYEVDGYGNALLMDDANVPSLLSAPYLGYCAADDEIYQHTRSFCWSHDNPYYYSGRDGQGIGGPHVGAGYAWPMSIIMRGLTADSPDEVSDCLRQLCNTDGGTAMMHEAFSVNDQNDYTRQWFAWANSLFGELVIRVHDRHPDLLKADYSQQPLPQADYNIIPLPREIQTDAATPGTLYMSERTIDDVLHGHVAYNAPTHTYYVTTDAGYRPTGYRPTGDAPAAGIPDADPARTITERASCAYDITVTAQGLTLTSASEEGIFRGRITLRKAIGAALDAQGRCPRGCLLPYVTIHDAPQYAYRGVHLDCSRHFFSVDFVKKYIDMMALHGQNVLHWHLTDDQGWRFEVKRYPLLTQVGGWRDGTMVAHDFGSNDHIAYGGYYTQEECREIVQYAAERYITVMPEIDLPGHMMAALAAYPELGCTGGPYKTWTLWGVADDVLCAGNPATREFIRGVLEELTSVFPSELIHLGGDECPKARWQHCDKCQAKIRELGIKAQEGRTAEDQLQNYLMHDAEQYLIDHGRKMIGWDEILEGGAAPSAAVMSWRGQQGGITAARQHHDVVMTPTSHCYLNFGQSRDAKAEPEGFDAYLPLHQVYAIEVTPGELTAEEGRHILGCQANLWTEYITTPGQAEWMLLPRLAAMAEAQWMAAEARDYEAFVSRLPHLEALYDVLGYSHSNKKE